MNIFQVIRVKIYAFRKGLKVIEKFDLPIKGKAVYFLNNNSYVMAQGLKVL